MEHTELYAVKNIILLATIGDENKQVILSQPQGSGELYHITIDNFFHGIVTKTMEGWKVYPNKNSWLSIEDCEVIVETVKNNFSQKSK